MNIAVIIEVRQISTGGFLDDLKSANKSLEFLQVALANAMAGWVMRHSEAEVAVYPLLKGLIASIKMFSNEKAQYKL